jgi:subtilisin family serine protease
MSLTSYAQVQVVQDALQYAEDNGVFIVAATGNDKTGVGYPAKYPTVFAVGATDHADHRAEWSGIYGSNYGPEVDVVAPGKAIYGINPFNNTTQYVTAGTSQAAPLAAGVAALMLAVDSTLTLDSIRAVMRRTADDEVGLSSEDTPGFDNYHGFGRLNAFEALKAVMPDTTTQDSGSTGISRLNRQSYFVYPNPAKETIRISGIPDGNYNVAWISVNGHVRRERMFINQNALLKTPASQGLYLVELVHDNGELYRLKVMVKR